MNDWGHPKHLNSGITYVATGMNLIMMNEARVQNLQYRSKRDFFKETTQISDSWDSKKQRWLQAAISSPTLESFLFEKFYKDVNK